MKMEHNLGDALHLENDMSSMDFEDTSVVEESTDEAGIAMEFENVKEEQMMMDTGGEEVIVSDFIGNPLTLEEYCISNSELQQTEAHGTILQTTQLTSQAQPVVDIHLEPESIKVKQESNQQQPKYITVKAANTKNLAPKQVMIAPKPPNFPSSGAQKSVLAKQYAIAPKPAPKPVQLIKSAVMKVSLANIMQATNTKPVLAQVGGKLVMLPARGNQKIKLLPASSGAAMHYVQSTDQQPQLVTKVTQASKQTKPVLTKVTVQGQSNIDSSNQPAVLTKLVPVATTTNAQQARYVMQQKTVPISLAGNKIIISSPTKQSNVKFGKTQQLVTVSAASPKLLPAPAQVANTKKVVISANPNHNVLVKTTPTHTVVSKESSLLLTQGQRTQLQQINVPGKGVQYIRLVSNNPPAKLKPAAQANTFMIADGKGNLIPVTAEKMGNNQPPLLVITGNVPGANKVSPKSPKKMVRITSVGTKPQQIAPHTRSSQSLLAPMSPTKDTPQMDDFLNTSMGEQIIEDTQTVVEGVNKVEPAEKVTETNEPRSLLAQNTEIHKFGDEYSITEVTVDFESAESMPPTEEGNMSEEQSEESKQDLHPLIVIPPNYNPNTNSFKEKTLVFLDEESEDVPAMDLEKDTESVGNMANNKVNVEAEIVPYMSPSPPPMLSDSEMVRSNDLGRPRKACNCTKSQCLKLYCDCFANGEFCNSCNCNNCHNNLENEELRQKAIRACLDRNPNAFRPKIGKVKSGGPELFRRHTKGCNCKRSGCLKNYCECFEAKIECTATCKCVGCRNVEDGSGKRRGVLLGGPGRVFDPMYRPPHNNNYRLPCSFMTTEVIEAVCQCLIAAAVESGERDEEREGCLESPPDPMKDVIEEFARCLQDIISASHQSAPVAGEE